MSNNRSLGADKRGHCFTSTTTWIHRRDNVIPAVFVYISWIVGKLYFVFEQERGRKKGREIEIVSPFFFFSTNVFITKDSIKKFRYCVLFTINKN